MNRILTVWLAFAAVAAGAATWEFTTGANPALSKSGAGRAVLAPGDFADGWIEANGLFGGATGVWDLGRNGTIVLSDPGVLAGMSAQRREITVRVTQWVDGGIYADYADVAVPGAVMETFDGRMARFGTIGGWMEDETVWSVAAGVTTESVVITGASNGSLVDQVSVVVATFTVDPLPVLSVRRLAGGVNRVELSWASSTSDWVVQTSESVSDANGWQALGEAITVTGERHSVVTEATGGARFFRLSKP